MNRPTDRNIDQQATACTLAADDALAREYVHIGSFAIGAAFALRWALGQHDTDPYTEMVALHEREAKWRSTRAR